MATAASVKNKILSLVQIANSATGGDASSLAAAVDALVAGYGGASLDDIQHTMLSIGTDKTVLFFSSGMTWAEFCQSTFNYGLITSGDAKTIVQLFEVSNEKVSYLQSAGSLFTEVPGMGMVEMDAKPTDIITAEKTYIVA